MRNVGKFLLLQSRPYKLPNLVDNKGQGQAKGCEIGQRYIDPEDIIRSQYQQFLMEASGQDLVEFSSKYKGYDEDDNITQDHCDQSFSKFDQVLDNGHFICSTLCHVVSP